MSGGSCCPMLRAESYFEITARGARWIIHAFRRVVDSESSITDTRLPMQRVARAYKLNDWFSVSAFEVNQLSGYVEYRSIKRTYTSAVWELWYTHQHALAYLLSSVKPSAWSISVPLSTLFGTQAPAEWTHETQTPEYVVLLCRLQIAVVCFKSINRCLSASFLRYMK